MANWEHGEGVCRAFVAPGRSGFRKPGAPGADLVEGAARGLARWPARRRTAWPWAESSEQGMREEREVGDGNFINKPKFKTQFCKFHFYLLPLGLK